MLDSNKFLFKKILESFFFFFFFFFLKMREISQIAIIKRINESPLDAFILKCKKR